ncbi:MAG TPA: type I DNA topoisomerase [Gemmatimonadaceae bacterium]|nr:type I DNA topoisomerase [Gemmatimonadaceae bacterium]
MASTRKRNAAAEPGADSAAGTAAAEGASAVVDAAGRAPAARKAAAKKGGAVKKVAAKKSAKAAAKSPAKKSAARIEREAQEAADDEAASASPGSTSLVIVESPAKAKTIGKYLGRAFRVKATVGHVRDLPEKKLGIDVENGFTPEYVTIEGKEKTLADLKSAAKDSREIFIATDPDREGEAIGWHVAGQIRRKGGAPIRRVLFHEITKDAVRQAIDNAGEIDERKVDAQQARRVLDRLVGYKASPLLWKTVKKGLSAGRVQTVALRLLVEREREIRAFKPVEYWTIAALLEHAGQQFTAKLHHVDGKKPEIATQAEAESILADVRGRTTFPVTEVKRRERRKNPAAPFTTSTLQQEAAKKLGFGSKRTMRLAQDLYEGIELGKEEGAVGLITYMRTDSTRVAESAATQARDYLRTLFGADFLAGGVQLYGKANASNAQDAHEGVRPTDPTRRPDAVKRFLKEDQFKLYDLIWKRFMASQMAPAVFDTTTVDFDLRGAPTAEPGATRIGRSYLFRSTGSVVKFQGFLALYREAREEGDAKALEDEQALPAVEVGEQVPVKEIAPSQHFTEPPPRFSEASLVKELERLGIGRPSTYASIISTLVDRRYAQLEQRRFFPTELGESVEKVMVKQFPEVFDVRFTSTMEGELDKVEEGTVSWQRVLEEFYSPFAHSLSNVNVDALIGEAHDLSKLADERCPDCGGKLVAKGGFFGPFVACENHPKTCKFTRPLSGARKPAEPTNYVCHECGAPMLKRQGRSGDFLGCSRFPKCRGTRSMPTGVMCPKDGGEIAERRSKKRGKAFYGCENYPNCDFVCWDKPLPEVCAECGYVGAEAKYSKARGHYRKCIKCGNEWDVPEPVEPIEPEAVAV